MSPYFITPSYGVPGFTVLVKLATHYWKVDPNDRVKLDEIHNYFEKYLIGRGFRLEGDILTPREHQISGGSHGSEYNSPDVPCGILEGHLEIPETQRARELQRFSGTNIGKHFCLDGSVRFSLEPLDNTTGKTVGLPKVLDDNLKPINTEYSKEILRM